MGSRALPPPLVSFFLFSSSFSGSFTKVALCRPSSLPQNRRWEKRLGRCNRVKTTGPKFFNSCQPEVMLRRKRQKRRQPTLWTGAPMSSLRLARTKTLGCRFGNSLSPSCSKETQPCPFTRGTLAPLRQDSRTRFVQLDSTQKRLLTSLH